MKEDWTNISRIIQLSEGELIIHGVTSPETLESLNIDIMLKAFRPAIKQKKALVEISKEPNSKVVSAQLNGELVGYVTFHPPEDFERWSAGPKGVIELGAIEVAPKIRKFGIGSAMLKVAFEDVTMEKLVVLATEYYWHWDLEGTLLHIWEYREIMSSLMSKVGMVVKDTDDEEISSHPANMLMVRYGKEVTNKTIQEFETILFLE
ncbi:MAG: GNAT family N-acetyltransferase [Eubacteriales bacterium]